MGGLAPGLWVLLLSAECACVCGVKTVTKSENLICYKCFKVSSPEFCHPMECPHNDTVCISHNTILYFGEHTVRKVSKRCAPRCPNGNNQQEWQLQKRVTVRLSRKCCSQSYCNGAPATMATAVWVLPGVLLPFWALH
ncbi:lymphocyte antigen 6L [Tenrec ecaudatus]|uniref:lymphocyte antigen 6L n=1 Tax=Tenrec ecaudatus TaxID=94439 RepID=UPI003F59162E